MKRLTIFLFSVALHAATYYVSSTGIDTNSGSSASPWLTLQHAVNTVACGDTINIVANGSYVVGDANLPYFPGCGATTTVQSSVLAQFAPIGYRTNPATDCTAPGTCIYGRLQFASQGIVAGTEAHGSYLSTQNYAACNIASVSSSIITLGYCGSGLPRLANGSQISFETYNAGNLSPTATVPPPLEILTRYYVVNCVGSCGTNGSTLQVSATRGGPPITLTTCNSDCIQTTVISEPLQIDTVAHTITSPDNLLAIANGAPVTFASAALQLFGTLPGGLQMDTIYYVTGLNGRTFQVSTSPVGSSIVGLSSVGTGALIMADTRVPHNWAFRGLELVEKPGSLIFNLFILGGGNETSINGMVNHMEVDRCWLHDNPTDVSGPNRGIADNGTYLYVHDSYIAGMRYGENQAIAGWGSPGPTAIINNFLEAASEVTLYGGVWNASGAANANKTFLGNYYYKPPLWKITANTGAASGPCWYDATDPNHSGGEWYTDTSSGQNYQCSSNGTWAPTGASVPTGFTIKNMAEHKNGRYFLYYGNYFNYSWASAQTGQMFAFHQGEDSGAGLSNDHITVLNNKGTNVFQAITMASHCNGVTLPCTNIKPNQHTIVNNLIVVSPSACGVLFTTGSNTCGSRMTNSTWGGWPSTGWYGNHNTIINPDGADAFGPTPGGAGFSASAFFASTDTVGNGCPTANGTLDYWTFKNSIIGYDFQGDCANGGGMFTKYFTHANFTNNALVGSTTISYGSPGATNIFANFVRPANMAAMQYADPTNGDYHLLATSPYSAANASATQLSDDGADLGADIDLVNMATSGAMAGTPPWDQQAGLRVNPGSSQVVFRYTAPTADPCTATIYSAPARIAGNQVASVADSSANSISDALARELYVSGLHPSTQYWYKLACGGGVLIVGNLLTRTPGIGTAQFGFDWNIPTPMQYSSSPSMANPVSLTADTRQFVPVAANSVVYVQIGTAGPITMLIAP